MARIERELLGESSQQTETEEKPPRRPEKIAIKPDADQVPMENVSRSRHAQTGAKSADRRHTYNEVAPRRAPADAADIGISGSDRARGKAKGRPSQSQDDLDVFRRMRGISEEEELGLRREVSQLRRQLKDSNSRADQAERAAEIIGQTLRAGSEAVATGNDSLTDTVERLREENKSLRAELDEAHSHIFSLQPYRKELTPEEVGRDFDDLFSVISDWVAKVVEPIVESDEKLEETLLRARKKPESTLKLRQMMSSHGDLVQGSMFPETDVDILIAAVMRFVHENIFQKILYGAQAHAVELMTFIESSMTTNVEPKRDLFALRTWQAEAYNAIICSPDFHQDRQVRIKELTLDLASGLQLFYHPKEHNMFCYNAQDAVIKPAVALHEKLLTSTHHFYLDLDPYIVWNQRRELEMNPDFLNNLDNLKCENILHNRKPVVFSKMEPKPTRQELLKQLVNVTTVAPGLYMRQIGKGEVIKEPIVVRKQHVLVAWGSQERREKFLDRGERTLMNRLYYMQREKQEKGGESAWASWKGTWT